jgi:hypothetical protein
LLRRVAGGTFARVDHRPKSLLRHAERAGDLSDGEVPRYCDGHHWHRAADIPGDPVMAPVMAPDARKGRAPGSGTRPAVRNTVSPARHLAAERPAPDVRHTLPVDRTAQRSPASLASRRDHGGCRQWPWPVGPSSTNWHSCSASPRKRTPPRLSSVRDNETEGPALSPDRIVTHGHRRTRARTSPLSPAHIARQPVHGSVPGVPRCYRRSPRIARCQQAEFVPGLGPWSGYCHSAKIPGVRHKLRSGEIRAGIIPMVHAVFDPCGAGKSCELSHVVSGVNSLAILTP